MKDLYILWHLGLGDAIICNGLVRYLARQRNVTVPCYAKNFPSVYGMFCERLTEQGTKISVHTVENNQDAFNHAGNWDGDVLRIGYHRHDFDPTRFDRSFYEQAEVPFEERWNSFYCPPSINEWTPPKLKNTSYAFIHEDRARGYCIQYSRIPNTLCPIYPYWSSDIRDYIPALRDATEIHCIDSCFALLADSVTTHAREHVLHGYAREGHNPSYKKFKIIQQ